MQTELHDDVSERLQRIEQMLELLVQQRTVKEWYSTAEVAKILGKAEFTVREWCRLKRIYAEKKNANAARRQNGSSPTRNSSAFRIMGCCRAKTAAFIDGADMALRPPRLETAWGPAAAFSAPSAQICDNESGNDT